MIDKSAPGYKWVLVGLLLCVGAVNYGDRSAIASVFPALRADLHLTDLQIAGVGSFFLWAYALASPLAGALADRFSRRSVLLWSLAAWSGVTLATSLVTDPSQLVLSRVLLGVAEAPGLPAALALIADYHTSRTRGTALGIYQAGSSLGVVAGGTSLAYLGQRYGWRPGFLVIGSVGLFLAVIAYRIIPKAPPPAERPGRVISLREAGSLLLIPTYAIILLIGMVAAVGTWIFNNWLPLYFKETFHMTLVGAGFAGTFALQIAAIGGTILGGACSDRVSRGQLRRRMTIMTVSCAAASPFLIVFRAAHPAMLTLSGCIFMFSFLMKFGTCNITVITCELLPASVRAAALGIANAANCLAGGAGIMLAGYLKATTGLGGVFAGISAMALAAALLTLLAQRCFLARDLARLRPDQTMGLQPAWSSGS